MNSDRLQRKISFKVIPILILFATMIYCIFVAATTNIMLVDKHYVGFFLLIGCSVFYFINTGIAQILTVVLILLGIFNIVAFTPTIGVITIGGGVNGVKGELISIQSFSFLIAVIFLIVNFGVLKRRIEKYRR